MALDANMQPGRGRVVMLATPLANESKTAIASNLALHYALTGRRALLVDGDLRRAVLTRTVLPTGARSGLLECLLRQEPIESAILRDGSTGLCYLPAFGPGQTPVPVPELLSSQATAAAFERLRGLFDIIVVDSPPIVPVVDGRVLAHHADELVFVAEWRRTTKDVARRALRLMAASYEKFVGFVVSDVDRADLGSDYSYATPAHGRQTTAHGMRRPGQHRPAAPRAQIGRAA
jgi:capsular exopolysaccharide synthesis family protein